MMKDTTLAFPLVFLDYDGVLTSTKETPGSYLNHDIKDYGTSPKCYSRLIKLCKDTSANIVITSNWRKFPDDGFWHRYRNEQVPNNLPALRKQLGSLIYSELPPERHRTKSECMEMWLKDHPEADISTLKYVIFDDDLREGFQNSRFAMHFVLTNDVGLTDKDCEKAKEILK